MGDYITNRKNSSDSLFIKMLLLIMYFPVIAAIIISDIKNLTERFNNISRSCRTSLSSMSLYPLIGFGSNLINFYSLSSYLSWGRGIASWLSSPTLWKEILAMGINRTIIAGVTLFPAYVLYSSFIMLGEHIAYMLPGVAEYCIEHVSYLFGPRYPNIGPFWAYNHIPTELIPFTHGNIYPFVSMTEQVLLNGQLIPAPEELVLHANNWNITQGYVRDHNDLVAWKLAQDNTPRIFALVKIVSVSTVLLGFVLRVATPVYA